MAQTHELSGSAKRRVAVAGATRPYPGEDANGDGWQVTWRGTICRLAVIDGLGHGPLAAAAAAAAMAVLAETHLPALGLVATLRACHQALIGTRGAAISLADIDPAAGHLTYLGVGNVEARLWTPVRTQRLITLRGIVGAVLPTLRTFEVALPPDWCLVMHSDGVSSRFDISAQVGSLYGFGDPQPLADEILAHWARPTDDATVLVARARKEPWPALLDHRAGVDRENRPAVG